MKRRERIRLTLDRIKVTKSLVAKLSEFIRLSREAGYEPAHSARTLEKFRVELAELRTSLTRLTLDGQRDFVRQQGKSHPIRQKAA